MDGVKILNTIKDLNYKLDFETALEILQNPIFDNYSSYMGAVLFVSEAFNMSVDSVLEHIKG